MIFARGEHDGKKLLIIGLSARNLERLKQDQPILIRKEKHKAVPDGWEIMIFTGDTEAAMFATLIKTGAITPGTVILKDGPT